MLLSSARGMATSPKTAPGAVQSDGTPLDLDEVPLDELPVAAPKAAASGAAPNPGGKGDEEERQLMAEHLAEVLAEERMAGDSELTAPATIQPRAPGTEDVLSEFEQQLLSFITEHFDAPGAPVPVHVGLRPRQPAPPHMQSAHST